MPLVGVVGEVSWRLAWLVVPVSHGPGRDRPAARQPATPPAGTRTGGPPRRASGTRACCAGRRGAARLLGLGRRARLRRRAPRGVVRPLDRRDRVSRSGSALSSTCPGTSSSGVGSMRTAGGCSSSSRSRQRRRSRVLYAVRPSVWFTRRGVRRSLVHRRRADARRERARARPRAGAAAGRDGRADRRRSSPATSSAQRSAASRSPGSGYSAVGLAFAACSSARDPAPRPSTLTR